MLILTTSVQSFAIAALCMLTAGIPIKLTAGSIAGSALLRGDIGSAYYRPRSSNSGVDHHSDGYVY